MPQINTEKITEVEDQVNTQEKKGLFKTKPSFFTVILVTIIFIKIAFLNGMIPSESMEATINIGDGIIVNKLYYKFNKPNYKDIVVFYKGEELMVKRIIGLPNDVISIKDSIVYVNNNPVEENYIKEKEFSSGKDISYIVPENSYFVLGDNRNNSLDSRFWKNSYIPDSDIIGRVKYKYNIDNKLKFTNLLIE